MFFYYFALIVFFTIFDHTLLFSQDTSDDKIYIKSKRVQILNDYNSQSISLDHPMFLETNTIEDILLKINGIYAIQTTTKLTRENIFIRGLGGQQIRIIIDDYVLSDFTDLNFLSQIPKQWIESIHISKGSQSAKEGNQGMGGVIHIKTKSQSNLISIQTGSFNTHEINAMINHQVNSHTHIGLKLSKDQSDRNYQYSNKRVSELYDDLKQSENLRLTNNEVHTSQLQVSLKYKKLRFETGLSETHRGVPGTIDQSHQEVNEQIYLKNINISFEKLKYSNIRFRPKTSYILEQQKYSDPLGEVIGSPQNVNSKYFTYMIENDTELNLSSSHNLTLRNRIQINSWSNEFQDHERLENFYSFIYHQNLWTSHSLQLAYSHTNMSDQEDQRAFQLNFHYSLSSNWSFETEYAQGFRYPTLKELYLNFGSLVGNDNLTPEKTESYSLSLSYEPSSIQNLQFKTSFFFVEAKDLISYEVSSGFQFKPFNTSRSQIEGLEFELYYQQPQSWSLALQTTYQIALDKTQNSDYEDLVIPNRPRYFGSLSLYKHLSKHVKISSSYIFAYERFSNRSNTKKVIDREILNLGLEYVVSPKYVFKFMVQNLFDRPNEDLRSFALPERSYFLQLKYAYD